MSADFYQRPIKEQLTCTRELALAALSNWEVECQQLELIKHRENAVYKLVTTDGTQYALRVHRENYHSDAALRSELQWMSALQQAGVLVPEVIACRNGDSFVSVRHPEMPAPRQVDLFAWVDGEQLGSVEQGLGDNTDEIQQIYATIGRIAAALHNQSTGWSLPNGFTRHAWDVEGLVGEQPFWGRFWDLAALTPARRGLLLRARDVVRKELVECGQSPDNYGLIHADFAPENLLVDGDDVRLIDFDDSGFGWHMFELATALYFIQDDPNYAIAKQALIESYSSHRAVSDETLATLPLMMLSRSFTYLGWVHTRPGTETAEELTPMMIEMSCGLAEEYLADY